MSFVVLSGTPVFLGGGRYSTITEEALKDWTHSERIDALIQGTSASRKVGRMIVQALKERYRRDPEGFADEWLDLRYDGPDAATVIWELLLDASAYHCTFRLVDLRSERANVLADWLGDPVGARMGGEFGVEFEGSPLRRLFGRWATPLQLTIQVREVTAIRGRLDAFWFDCAGWRFVVGRRWSASLHPHR